MCVHGGGSGASVLSTCVLCPCVFGFVCEYILWPRAGVPLLCVVCMCVCVCVFVQCVPFCKHSQVDQRVPDRFMLGVESVRKRVFLPCSTHMRSAGDPYTPHELPSAYCVQTHNNTLHSQHQTTPHTTQQRNPAGHTNIFYFYYNYLPHDCVLCVAAYVCACLWLQRPHSTRPRRTRALAHAHGHAHAH